MAELKLFNKWDTSSVKVDDAGLVDYITLKPVIVPKTGARYGGKKFYKSKVSIVERLMNKLMIPGHKGKKHYISSGTVSGKGMKAFKIVEGTFKIIESRTKKNPVEVFVKAIENAAPREEIVTIEYGGARYPKAVECAPQRRIDIALRYMTQGAFIKAFNTKKAAEDALADEIIAAYGLSSTSAAISKKLDLERQADASR